MKSNTLKFNNILKLTFLRLYELSHNQGLLFVQILFCLFNKRVRRFYRLVAYFLFVCLFDNEIISNHSEIFIIVYNITPLTFSLHLDLNHVCKVYDFVHNPDPKQANCIVMQLMGKNLANYKKSMKKKWTP